METNTDWRQFWIDQAARLDASTDEAGLAAVSRAFRDAMHPLLPLFAQALWVAAPTSALMGLDGPVNGLADLLDGTDAGLSGADLTHSDKDL